MWRNAAGLLPDSRIVNARDPQREARELVGDALAARVLEPSPPARDDEWFADDPVNAPVPPGVPVVSPIPGADLTWTEWVAGHPEHAGWARERWLEPHRRLTEPGPAFAETRLAVHRLAAYVISPARRRVNGKIGLRWTLGGLGTPFFGEDEQVRLQGGVLVRQRGATASGAVPATLAQAAALAFDGPPDIAWAEGFDVPPAGGTEAALAIDPASAALLADWFGFGHSVLEELRADSAPAEAGRVQIWPEHFDAAVDVVVGGGGRATFGASPGDAALAEPYLYALPPDPRAVARGELWNADGFTGAILPLSGFVDAADQRQAALAFLRARRDALRASS
jgi:hypothetical protein